MEFHSSNDSRKISMYSLSMRTTINCYSLFIQLHSYQSCIWKNCKKRNENSLSSVKMYRKMENNMGKRKIICFKWIGHFVRMFDGTKIRLLSPSYFAFRLVLFSKVDKRKVKWKKKRRSSKSKSEKKQCPVQIQTSKNTCIHTDTHTHIHPNISNAHSYKVNKNSNVELYILYRYAYI